MKFSKEKVDEVSPPGWEKTVKAMKKHKDIDNPYALAWYMKGKGYKSRKESVELEESTPAYRKMLKDYEKSDDKKVFDILDKKGFRAGEQGDILVRNMLKKFKGNVKKAAAEIEKKYSNRFESVEQVDELKMPKKDERGQVTNPKIRAAIDKGETRADDAHRKASLTGKGPAFEIRNIRHKRRLQVGSHGYT